MTETPTRLKHLMIPHRVFVDFYLLLGAAGSRVGKDCFLSLPVLDAGLPDGTRVIDMRDDPYRREFMVVLEHPSFEPVPPGQEIPLWGDYPIVEKIVKLRSAGEDEDKPVYIWGEVPSR